MRFMFVCSLCLLASTTFAQAPVVYLVSFPNAAHHEAEITVTFKDISDDTLKVRMSRTSPGRYALHEFAKNVYNVLAVDGKGKDLTATKVDPHQWNITGHNRTVKVSYTIFGDRADGTYMGIDHTHAHMNIPATFMWARGMEDRQVEIQFEWSDSTWKVATQLKKGKNASTYTAPDLAYFIDSPVEISAFDLRTWEVTSGNKEQSIRLAIHHDGTEAEVDAYTQLVQAVVVEETAIFGELPTFDFGEYTFISDYLPYVNGDGMEHRNSTILASTGNLEENYIRLLGTVSHEFFHCWNVERIRPRSLEPFNLEAANMSSELWFAEGFTSYYDDLVLKRAHIISLDQYASGITRSLSVVHNAPGRKLRGPAGMSQFAPFVDAGVSIDQRNFSNTFISYYTYGAMTGLALDLTLRKRFPGVTLDEVMKEMWTQHGKSEIPYTNDDIERVLGEVTGDRAFAKTFFNQYIHQHDLVDYKDLLAQAGLLLREAYPGKAWLGSLSLSYAREKTRVTSPTLIGTPIYQSGVDRGDVIYQIDSEAILSEEDLDRIIENHAPGDTVTIKLISRGVDKTAQLIFRVHPGLEVVPFEHADREVTVDIEAFRRQWLETRVPGNGENLRRYCHTCKRAYPFAQEYCWYDGDPLQLTSKQ